MLLHGGRSEDSIRNFFTEVYELYVKVRNWHFIDIFWPRKNIASSHVFFVCTSHIHSFPWILFIVMTQPSRPRHLIQEFEQQPDGTWRNIEEDGMGISPQILVLKMPKRCFFWGAFSIWCGFFLIQMEVWKGQIHWRWDILLLATDTLAPFTSVICCYFIASLHSTWRTINDVDSISHSWLHEESKTLGETPQESFMKAN